MLRGKIHHGWVMVFLGVIITAMGIGAYNSTNSIFVKPVCDAFGFSRAEFTLHRTIITLAGAFLLPLYGRMIKKVGLKPILAAGSIMIGAVIIGYSFATQLWHFYALAIINGVFLNGVNFMVIAYWSANGLRIKRGLQPASRTAGVGLAAR